MMETKGIVLTWFEVVMDDRRLDFVQVLKSADCLDDDRPCLLLRNQLILFQVEVQVVALTVFENRTETKKKKGQLRRDKASLLAVTMRYNKDRNTIRTKNYYKTNYNDWRKIQTFKKMTNSQLHQTVK